MRPWGPSLCAWRAASRLVPTLLVPALLLVTSFALLLSVAACSKEEAGADKAEIPGLPKVEIQRARTACQSYQERVCACAAKAPELATDCKFAGARIDALETNLELTTAPGLNGGERKAVRVEARKIAAACFEADGRLDAAACPRL